MGLAFPTKELFLSQNVSCKLGEGSCLSGLKTPDRAYLGMLAEGTQEGQDGRNGPQGNIAWKGWVRKEALRLKGLSL